MTLAEGEQIGLALRRFKKLLERDSSIRELRDHVYFIPATQVRRAKRFRRRFKTRKAALHALMAEKQSARVIAAALAAFWKRSGKP